MYFQEYIWWKGHFRTCIEPMLQWGTRSIQGYHVRRLGLRLHRYPGRRPLQNNFDGQGRKTLERLSKSPPEKRSPSLILSWSWAQTLIKVNLQSHHSYADVFWKKVLHCVLLEGQTLCIYGRLFICQLDNGNQSLLIKALLNETIASVKEPSKDAGKVSALDLLKRVGLDGEGRKNFHEAASVFKDSKNPIIIAGERSTGFEDP